MYSLLNLIHGMVHKKPEMVNLLKQNKYYFIPSVNVDGVWAIEDEFIKSGKIITKRKNARYTDKRCGVADGGVDLNRNYDINWSMNNGAKKALSQCSELYPGKGPFSEPETQAMRDFLTKHKEELSFVYNFHCAGNMYIFPYNTESPNLAATEIPATYSLFQDIIAEGEFPSTFTIGPAAEVLNMYTGGSSGDWINNKLGVPAAEVEIGTWD